MKKYGESCGVVLKKIISLVMIFSFAVISFPVDAAVLNYTAGPRIYYLDLDNPYIGVGVSTYQTDDGETGIKLEPNGKVTYRFYMPFTSERVVLRFDDKKMVRKEYVDYTCIINGKKWNVSTRVGDTTQYIDTAYPFLGDNTITIEAKEEIYIKGIEYKKKTHYVTDTSGDLYSYDYDSRPTTEFSDYEYAVHTALIVNENSPVIKVDGARRYLDYNNTNLKPMVRNGKLYIPLKTLGYALDFYTEELPNKQYALLRNDAVEYLVKDGITYTQIGNGEYEQINELFVFEGGMAWAPLRFFAERIGKTVVYKDGFTFVDYWELAHNLANEKFQEVKEDFAPFLSNKISGKTYYVAKTANASDNNDGSSDHPFLTLNKAGSVAKAGDTVIIREGTYRETFAPKNSGTEANPIVYKAADGEKVTISALEPIGTPEKNENGLWSFDAGWTLGQGRNLILNNGDVIAEGRHPNENTQKKRPSFKELGLDLSPLWPTIGNIDVLLDDLIDEDGDGKDDLKREIWLTAGSPTDLNQESGYWTGGTLVSFHGRGWNLGTAKIEDSEDGMLYLGDATKTWWFDNMTPIEYTRDPFVDYAYITNHINTVDMPGEWYWSDDGKIYMYPLAENFDFSQLEGKARQLTIDMRYSKYIHLENINTVGGSMNLNDSIMCIINGGNHEYISHYTYSDDQHYGFLDGYDVFDANGSPLKGELGITIGGRDNAVVNTEIKYSAGAGLYLSGLFTYVENNLIEETGYMSSYVGGIYLTAIAATQDLTDMRGGHGIYNNTVSEVGRGCFVMGSIEAPWFQKIGMTPFVASDIAYNKFINACIVARDTGIMYLHGTISGDDRAKMKIHHNLVGNSWNVDGGATNIYFDNYIQNGECFENVTYSKIPTGHPYNVQGATGTMGAVAGSFSSSFATIEVWNIAGKSGIHEGGYETLTEKDYPGEQYFESGYSKDRTTTFNYEKFDGTSTGYSAVNAKLKGAEIRSDAAYFTEDNGYVLFENVDFTGTNSIRLRWKGNYMIREGISVYVGDSLETARRVDAAIDTFVPTPNIVTYQDLYIKGGSGTQNVYIVGTKGSSLGVVEIETIKVDQSLIDQQPDVINYFVDYTELVEAGSILEKYDANAPKPGNILYNTMGSGVIKFKDIKFNTKANAIMVHGASEGIYSGQTIEIRLNTLESEPIAKFTLDMSNWKEYETIMAELNKVIEPGEYDVYVSLERGSKSANLLWFGFGYIEPRTSNSGEDVK